MFATQYRPRFFSEVQGQEIAKESLKAIAAADGVKIRSIVIHGPYGCSKTTLSRLFAKAVNCENFKKTGDVCNECAACKDVDSPRSLLYQEYDATRVGNVDSIKSLIDVLQINNFSGRRVICIDEIHAGTKQAQTALLKVLEDGVPNTFFVFVTTDEILQTIKSRSAVLEITTLTYDQVSTRIHQIAQAEGVQVSQSVIESIYLKSKGHMRDAVTLLEQYTIAGEEVLRTSLKDIRKYVLTVLQKKPADDIIAKIAEYPLIDVQSSIRYFLTSCFTATEGFEFKLKQTGLSMKLFKFFYSPEAQQAMKDEVGIIILLRALASII